MSQKPTVGRIVHLAGTNGQPIAAIVTEVLDNGNIKATAFPTTYDYEWEEATEPGQVGWSWPLRD